MTEGNNTEESIVVVVTSRANENEKHRRSHQATKGGTLNRKGAKGQYQPEVEKSRWLSLRSKLKEVTRKTTPMSFATRMRKLKEVHRGWINAFRLANIQGKLKELDGWLRSRMRYCIWHHWNRNVVELTTGRG